MKPDDILEYCLDRLPDTVSVNSWGESGIFYNPNNILKRGIYVLTVKEKDGDNDNSSEQRKYLSCKYRYSQKNIFGFVRCRSRPSSQRRYRRYAV